MTTLILVRHGQASFGAANYDKLSSVGRRQSEVLRDHWHQCQFHSDAVFSGTLSRQRDTAALALPDSVRKEDAAFNEYDFEGIQQHLFPLLAREHPELPQSREAALQNPRAFFELFRKAVTAWLEGREVEGGLIEPWRIFADRVREGTERLAGHGHKRIAVFTSGGVISALVQQTLGLPELAMLDLNLKIRNTSLHELRYTRRGWSLESFNSTAHLELMRDPSLITLR